MYVILIGFLTVVLVLVCIFITLVILMQRPSANAGMGAALGGGASEQVFGAQAGNLLTKLTIYGLVAFFVLATLLYLMHISTLADSEATPAGIRDLQGEVQEGATLNAVEEAAEEQPTTAAETTDAAAEEVNAAEAPAVEPDTQPTQ